MINIASTVKISFRALRVNKMRSALTMLGIIIGVGAVIAMLAVGTGASRRISEQISKMGSNLLMIVPGTTTAGGVRMGSGTQPTLTLADAEAILKESRAVSDVAPVLSGVAQVVYGHQNWSTGVVGTTPGMLNVRDWPLASGRSFTQQDVKSATKVCLLGQTVVENLFGDMDPIGQFIRIKNLPFTVIGVLAPKGQSPQGQDQDDTIYVPVTTAQKKLFGTTFPGMVRTIMVKAKSTEDLASAEKQINELLRQRHRIGPKQDNDFTVRNLTQFMQAPGTVNKSDDLITRSHRIGIPACRRDRDHEYHARIGYGEDKGDRDTDGYRSKDMGYKVTVHHRSAYLVVNRRGSRDYRRHISVGNYLCTRRLVYCCLALCNSDSHSVFQERWEYSSGFILPTRHHCLIR